MQAIAQIRSAIETAIVAANRAYINRPIQRGRTPVLDDDGVQSDIKVARAVFAGLSDGQIARLVETLDVDFSHVAGCFVIPDTKNLMRSAQFLGFLASGDGGYLKGSAKTALLTFAVCMLGAKTRAGVLAAVSKRAPATYVDAAIDIVHVPYAVWSTDFDKVGPFETRGGFEAGAIEAMQDVVDRLGVACETLGPTTS